jgi:uncharacterized membrane protein YdfJ with MMPL/SSD domain
VGPARVVLPVKALALNALSLTAVFGALVWIFQDGHLSGLLDFTPTTRGGRLGTGEDASASAT